MNEQTPQQKAHAKYEEKRKGKPRFGGYLTEDEKRMFVEALKLSSYSNEKEMIISLVAKLHKELTK